MTFKDLFSVYASEYAAYRPRYSTELFDLIATRCPKHDLAWDCATGNGQATVDLITVAQALHWFDIALFSRRPV